ncbi:hypothetical protein ANCCEY_02891 [Ancylostoma ceylanicum]|uniref:Uncharacterized protein n=1 Tax=Ancylostoma ceylanicum TaxID=53326 RepID=A0A0D6MBV4_9BILA|nr:hypothetical protein ANCCEY_02891 [Ancylostoma ceylanicum]
MRTLFQTPLLAYQGLLRCQIYQSCRPLLIIRKIAQGLRQIQHHDIDKDMLNELYPSLNRLNQAVTYSFDCAQSPISSDFYEFLSSRINEDDQDDDSRGRGRGRGRGRNQLTKIQNLIGAASECLEDYCGS